LEAVLWVNFPEPRQFSNQERARMRALLESAVKYIPRIHRALGPGTLQAIARSIHILRSITQLATVGQTLVWYLEQILSGVFEAFQMDDDDVGTVHIYDATSQKLRVAGRKGNIRPDARQEQDVPNGEGVVAWVALHKRAILIENLDRSEFRQIHVPIFDGTVSELAVPMLSGDELLGVVNLESRRRGRFTAESVRALWFAANQAAVACRLVQQVNRNEQLLRIAHDAIAQTPAGTQPTSARERDAARACLSKLATLARDWLGAGECDIWQFDDGTRRFTHSGATYRNVDSPPRENGWSHYIRAAKHPVWISDVSSPAVFRARHWVEETGTWSDEAPPGRPPPREVNETLISLGVKSEIGMPLRFKDQCIGVAWLKFLRAAEPPPGREMLRLAEGFAAHGGLVIDMFSRYQERTNRQQFFRDYAASHFSNGAFSFEGIEGYVIRSPHGDLGGDFHAIQSVGKGQTGFLIGDAESHGLTGGLYMLPLISAFKVVARESESAKHTLLRLVPTCMEWNIRTTALYFVVKLLDDGRALLFVSSAGHPPLLIVDRKGKATEVPHPTSWANMGQMGMFPDTPLAENVYELSDGDVVIAYTDGVKEAGKFSGRDEPDEHSIIAAAVAHLRHPPEEIAHAIERSALERAEGRPEDDMTILVFKLGPRRPQ
jgi:serine phosphatase RsbU (regulator of sigma subunit)/putative methionine-R-sulfoxide reductase with GAF domain